ncbi:MltA domain-containing protein [Thermosulfuriphilus sp.]
MRRRLGWLALFLLVLLGALFLRPLVWERFFKRLPYESWPVTRLPLVDQGPDEGLFRALSASRAFLERSSQEKFPSPLGPLSRKRILRTLEVLEEAFRLPREERSSFLRDHLVAYRLTPALLVTGYYEPLIRGARRPSSRFNFPIYRCPTDLVTVDLTLFGLEGRLWGRLDGRFLVPYYTREEIDIRGALRGRSLELFWLEDPIEAYFLQIQGSGVIELPQGEKVRVHFACANGWPYKSLSQLLPQSKEIKGLEDMKKYLRSLPDPLALLAKNPRYVFFEEVTRGPLGALGEVLVPFRSVALDHRFFPPGVPLFLLTELPSFSLQGQWQGTRSWGGLVFNHDKGAAIKGLDRLDLFLGTGDTAGRIAGRLKAEGEIFLLLAPSEDQREVRND